MTDAESKSRFWEAAMGVLNDEDPSEALERLKTEQASKKGFFGRVEATADLVKLSATGPTANLLRERGKMLYAALNSRLLKAKSPSGQSFARSWAERCAQAWGEGDKDSARPFETMLFPPRVALSRNFEIDRLDADGKPRAVGLSNGGAGEGSEGPTPDSASLVAAIAAETAPGLALLATLFAAKDSQTRLLSGLAKEFVGDEAFVEFKSKTGDYDPPKAAQAEGFAGFESVAARDEAMFWFKGRVEELEARQTPGLLVHFAMEALSRGKKNGAKPFSEAAEADAAASTEDEVDDLVSILDDEEDEEEEGSKTESKAGEGLDLPWRIAAKAMANEVKFPPDAFCETAAALGWNSEEDLGPEPWAEGLAFGDNSGETLRSILDLPLLLGRHAERLAGGARPVKRMLDEAWARSGESPRLRAICSQLWDWGRKDSEARLALREFCEESGAAAAVWLAGRTVPKATRAFLAARGVEADLLPTEDEAEKAEACSENFANRIWDAEPEAAELAWSEALLGELARFDGDSGSGRRWAAAAAGFASSLRSRLERFGKLDEKEKEEAEKTVGTGQALALARLREEARGPKKAPAEALAALAASFAVGAGAGVGQELKDKLLSAAGFGGALPEGWGALAGAAIGATGTRTQIAGCGKLLAGLAARASAEDLAALAGALAGNFAERLPNSNFEPVAKALGEAFKKADWRKALASMPRGAACELALRASASAEAGLKACAPIEGSAEAARKGLGLGLPAPAAEALAEAWAASLAERAPEDLEPELEAWRRTALWKPESEAKKVDPEGVAEASAEAKAAQAAEGSAETKAEPEAERPSAEIWTEEEWKSFQADVESVENKDAFGAARGLIKKVADGKVGPKRTLAMSGDLFRQLDLLAERFPHFAPMVARLWEFCRLAEAGDGALWFPPMLMVGGAGIGKTYFASTLADLAGTRLEVADLGGATAGWEITGLSDSWSTGKPGRVFRSLAYGDRANPVFLLDEIDKADGDPRYSISGALLPLLEPHSARRFADECVPLRLDASRICWLATANDSKRMSAPLLSRFDLFHLPNPNQTERRAMCSGIYEAVVGKFSWGAALAEKLPEASLDKLAALAAEGAARDLRRSVTSGCAKAVAAGRREILPEDLPEPESSRRDPWDEPLPEESK